VTHVVQPGLGRMHVGQRHPFHGRPSSKTKHMKRFRVIRIIGVVLLVVGVALISVQIMEGGKSVIQTIVGAAVAQFRRSPSISAVP